jgi:ELWxxDGT repeat protein
MPSRNALAAFCFPLVLLTAWGVQAQPAFRVADLNTTVAQHSSTIYTHQKLVALGSQFFFVADDAGAYGTEIWRSDGTLAGTRLLADVCPGSCSSNPGSLTISNGRLFFTADDGVHGRELWKSDGTTGGTSMVAEILPGRSVWISDLIDADGVLFFFAADGVHGYELWTSDGTTAGTHLVKDIAPGSNWINGRFMATSGHRLLFAAYHGVQWPAPWVSDGTEEGTVMVADIRPGASAVDPYYDPLISGRDAAPAPQGGFLFAADDGTGTALWLTDGTPGGTARLSAAASPHEMTVFQGAVYFAASDPAATPDPAGVELWKSDGTPTGTMRVKDIQAGTPGADPRELTVAGTRLFFRATDGAHGAELWKSDGTTAGTVEVTDLIPGAGDTFPFTPGVPMRYQLSALGNELAFFAYDGPSSLHLWRTNGGAITKLTTAALADSIPYFDRDAVALGGRVYFLAGRWGTELWSSDGTPAGTRSLLDVATSTSSVEIFNGKAPAGALAPVGNQIFFAATDGGPLIEPWKTDGTPGGTSRIASLPFDQTLYGFRPWNGGAVFLTNLEIWSTDGTASGTRTLGPGVAFGSLPALNGSLFYIVSDLASGMQKLWKTDGTPGGTSPVAVLSTFDDGDNMVTSGGKLFVPGFENGTGYSLWVTDGTAAPIVHISGAAHGQDFSQIGRLVDVGGTVLFPAYTLGYGWELWKSDGTAAGTTLLKSSGDPSDTYDAPYREAAGLPGGPLFFILSDVAAGAELWKSDGTTAGTVRVADIAPGPAGSNPHQLTAAGGKLYFTANDGVHGDEPWVSDGTAAGTHMVADLRPGPDSSHPDSFSAVGGTLLFSATDGVHGVEPWRTGGTATGTRMVQDIAPGSLSSSPSGFTAAGPNVYFAANDNTTGFELWAVPKSNVQASFADVPTTYWAWGSVEAVAAAGITLGCGQGLFCAERTLTRAEMGVFLGRGLHGSAFTPPPATGTRFADVPASYWAADWIEQIATDGVTQGCAVSPSRYCPAAQVARAEMAIFLLRARHGGSYVPPPATGTRFADVPASFWAAAWIEQLAAEGITSGCDVNLYCPNKMVGRAEMAVFLTRAFNLLVP